MNQDETLGRLHRLAQASPEALSPDGWQRLAAAGLAPEEREKGGFRITGEWVPSLDAPYAGNWRHRDQVEELAKELAPSNSAIYGLVQTYLHHYRQAALRCWRGPFLNLPGSELADVHGVTRLFRRASRWWRFGEMEAWRRTMMLFDGNAYLVKRRAGSGGFLRNVSGRVEGLDLVSPAVMWPVRKKGSRNLVDHFALQTGEGRDPLQVPRRNVIHFRHGLDTDLVRGVGPVKALAREIVTDDEADIYILAYLKNLGAPGLFFAPKEMGIPVDQDAVEAKLKSKVTGTHRGEPIVFRTPVDFHQFHNSTDAMDLGHVRRTLETRMASAIGVPAGMAQLGAGLDSSTYSNTASFVRQFNETTMMSAWNDDAETWTDGLGPDYGFGEDHYLGYDWTTVKALQDDLNELWERGTKLWEANGLTLGQLHQMLDLGPVPAAMADQRFTDLQPKPSFPSAGTGGGAGGGGGAPASHDRGKGRGAPAAQDRGDGDAAPPVDPAAVIRAAAAWRGAAAAMPGRRAAAGMLAAPRTKGAEGWSFDPREAVYSAAGAPLSDEALWDLVDARQDLAADRMRRWSEELRDGLISIETWKGRMGTEIMDAMLQLRMLAVGGQAGLTDADLDAVRQAVEAQWAYLAGFAAAITAGELTWPQVIARAVQYAGAALREIFSAGLQRARQDVGHDEKRRIGPMDGETCRDCWNEALLGWVPMNHPGLVIGRTECRALDRCRILTRRRPPDPTP